MADIFSSVKADAMNVRTTDIASPPRTTSVRGSRRSAPKHAAASARPSRRSQTRRNQILSVIWAVIPVPTLGMGAPFTFTYAAIRLRSKALGWCAALYGVVAFAAFYLLGGPDSDSNWQANVGTALALVLTAVATAHAFAIRPALLPTATSQQLAIDEAKERLRLRAQARQIVATNPQLADELQIGRPELERRFDDGGLVDVNHVSPATLTALPGIDASLAHQIVSLRDTIGGFESLNDLSATLDVPPQVFDRAADILIFRR